MAIAKAQTQVQWAGANLLSVLSGGNGTSDAVPIADAAIAGSLTIKADNDGVPAAGDVLSVYILYSTGDPDADPDAADEYDTYQHVLPIELNTFTEDPAIKTIPIDPAATKFQLHVRNAAASAVTISAQYSEQTNT